MKINTIELLRKAREILKSDGWTTGELKDFEGRHCALGAIYEAAGLFDGDTYFDSDNKSRASKAIKALAQAIVGKSSSDMELNERRVWNFNDHNAADERDVIAKFNDAIRLVKQGETA